MSPSNQAPNSTCNCNSCTGIRSARAFISTIPLDGLSPLGKTPEEYEAVLKINTADKLLSEAEAVLHQKHTHTHTHTSYNGNQNGMRLSPRKDENSPPLTAHDSALVLHSNRSSPTKESNVSPTHDRQFSTGSQITDPYSGATPPKDPRGFEGALRARAAELGILRGTPNVPPPVINTTQTAITNIHASTSPIKEKSKFIVCDHCRSHGLRCNEASVCKECILREVPCTHRQCDLSPNDKEACERQVCFYVHSDWMPDVYGSHNPDDPNWIILPGKLREHHSAGQLGKLPHQSEADTMRCYQGVTRRQQEAIKEMSKCVQSGQVTWESVAMQCACVEIEREQERTRMAEENVRRLTGLNLAGTMG